MRKILLIHFVLWCLACSIFYGLGAIDKSRFDKASLEHKPSLLFAHNKLLVSDGGSVHWESLMYSAHEGRRMRVWKSDGKTVVADGFQGKWWSWNHENLLWLTLLVGASFVGSMFTFNRMNGSVEDS